MTPREIKAAMSKIRDDMVDTASGVSRMTLAKAFDDEFPDVRQEMGDILYEDYLRKTAAEVVNVRKASQKLTLPGIGDFQMEITTYNGEGEFVHKRLRFAGTVDLDNDVDIMTQNAAAAVASAALSEFTRDTLKPVMVQHGFTTAGEAIEYLTRNDPPPTP